jgi:hypothetical protein
VSGEAAQRFSVTCPHCAAILQGTLLTRPEEGVVSGLNLDGRPATLVEETDDTPVVNVATDVLMEPTARSMVDPGGSAFMMHLSALGEGYMDWRSRLEQFEQLMERDWQNIVRWWGYYTSNQLEIFDSHAREYWSDDWPDDPSDLDSHDAVHRALELTFFHV